MKDIYSPGLDRKIQEFLKRKADKYPELHLLDGQGQGSIRPGEPKQRIEPINDKPPRFVIHTF